jgi:hypothetical protein
MKKIIISLALCLSALAVSARDYSYPVGYYRLQSNHSISTTLLGLEYSYEGRVADRWTLIGRAGIVPLGFTLYTYPDVGVVFDGTMGLGLSFEGRWYSSIARRVKLNRSTYNNSSDFISMRLRASTTPDGADISFTPSYGFRRAIGKHWVQEFTLGPKIGVGSDEYYILPHVQYRIGFVF